jgi:hypothetical protein
MSTFETILARAMSDAAFADALFAEPEKALVEYDLPADVIAKFKNISRAEFDTFDSEERRSMSTRLGPLKKASGQETYMKFSLGDLKISN